MEYQKIYIYFYSVRNTCDILGIYVTELKIPCKISDFALKSL